MQLSDLVGGNRISIARNWSELVGLWRAGLDTDGWLGILGRLRLVDALIVSRSPATSASNVTESYLFALLAGDTTNGGRLRFGLAMQDALLMQSRSDPSGTYLARVYAHTVGIEVLNGETMDDDDMTALVDELTANDHVRDEVVGATERLLLTRQPSASLAAEFLDVLDRLNALGEINPLVLLMNVCRFPELIRYFPKLADPELYRDPAVAVAVAEALVPSERGSSFDEDTPASESDSENAERGKRDDAAVRRRTSVRWAEIIFELRVRAGEELTGIDFSPELKGLLERLIIGIRDDGWTTREQTEPAVQAGRYVRRRERNLRVHPSRREG